MTLYARTRAALAAALLGSALALSGGAPAFAQKDRTVSADVGKPVRAAQNLAAKKKYKAALNQLAKADKAKKKSAYEEFVIDQTRAYVYQSMGRYDDAAEALEASLKGGSLSKADRAERLQAIAQLWFTAKDYEKAALYGRKAMAAGADGLGMLVAQSDYQAGDYAKAQAALKDAVAGTVKAGKEPDEATIQLLGAAAYQAGDMRGYADALQTMVRYHPSPEAWKRVIATLETMDAFPEALELDLSRLKLATGTLAEPQAYMTMAQNAVLARLPGEAQAILAQGFQDGTLGQGPSAARHERLQAYVETQAAQQRAKLPAMEAAAKSSRDAAALARVGMARAGLGEHAQGAALMRTALEMGGLPDREATMLRMGVNTLKAGRRDQAEAVLAGLPADTAEGRLAALWLLTENPQS